MACRRPLGGDSGGGGGSDGGGGGGSGALTSIGYIVRLIYLLSIPLSINGEFLRLEERTGDFCDTEMFRAECLEDEVVIMKMARYGRMRVGRCVEYDLGYIDCYSDILIRMDRRCSGRRACEFRIPDAEFESTDPCLKELKTYLEVSYFCVPVETVSADYCSAHSYINLTLPSGYIASELYTYADRPSCDHTLYPWVIIAQRGQHINLTLYDFALDNAYATGFSRGRVGGPPAAAAAVAAPAVADVDRVCRQYGWLEDSGAERPTRICGGERRVSEIYVSSGNIVKIWTVAVDKPNDQQRKFIIAYTVVGCPDPEVLPDQTWFERSPDGYASIGCQKGEVKWLVQCIDNSWTGFVGNCSSLAHQQMSEEEFTLTEEMTMPYGLAIGIGAVIGVLIALVIVLVIGCKSKPDREMISQKRSSLQLNYLEGNYMYDKAPMIKCACGLSTRLSSIGAGAESQTSGEGSIGGVGDSFKDYRFGPPQQPCCHLFPHHQCHDHEHHHQQLNQTAAAAADRFSQSERLWESPLSRIDLATKSQRSAAADQMSFTVVSVLDPDERVGGGGTGGTAVVSAVTPQHDRPLYASSAAFGVGQQDTNLGGAGGGIGGERGGGIVIGGDYGTRCSTYSSQDRCARQKQLLHQQQLMLQQQHQQQQQQRKMDV